MAKTALLAGSTGLIGSQLLGLLLTDDHYSSVTAISRKPLSVTSPKLINLVCELHDLSNHRDQLKVDDVFCCLGTTIKKAKTKEAFRAVDLDAPLQLAKITKEAGARKFLLVSSLGANKSSGIFYNQVKGEVEGAIQKVGFNSCHILRPSLLLGSRKEERTGEDAAKLFYKVFGFLVPKRYEAIESMQVAKAMLHLASTEQSGAFIYESNQIKEF
jgi:uncharacterized protein YbjT (DUF2867 family)